MTTSSTTTIPATISVAAVLLDHDGTPIDSRPRVVNGFAAAHHGLDERVFEIVVPQVDAITAAYYVPVSEADLARAEATPQAAGIFPRLKLTTVDGERVSVSRTDLPPAVLLHVERLADAQAAAHQTARDLERDQQWNTDHTCNACHTVAPEVTPDLEATPTGEQYPRLCPPCRNIVTRLREESGRLTACRQYVGLDTNEPKRRR